MYKNATRKAKKMPKKVLVKESSRLMKEDFRPRTKNQEDCVISIAENVITIVNGLAGTGKTAISCGMAASYLCDNKVDKIFITRPMVQCSKGNNTLGALRGDLNEKFLPYMFPLIDELEYYIGKEQFRVLVFANTIEIMPIELCRGRSLKNSFIIVDECFPDSTYITTENGKINIKTIVNSFKNKTNKEYKVLSYNEKTNKTEYKKVINAFSSGIKDICKITLGKVLIECTENHPFFVYGKGWIRLKDLQLGDPIYTNCDNMTNTRSVLNDDQNQAVIGSLLGDSSLVSTADYSYSLKTIHGIKQREYCEWKHSLYPSKTIEYVEKNGYSQKPAIRFTTCKFYTHHNIKDTNYLIDHIDLRSLAIAWMDDGYYNAKVKHGKLFSCADNEINNKNLCLKLNSMGYSCIDEQTVNGNGAKYFQIRFRNGGFDKFTNDIAPFIHISMSYKIPDKYHNLIGTYIWDANIIGKTLSVTKIDYNIKKEEVFDLTIEDNHNFFVSKRSAKTSLLAHNCQNCTYEQILLMMTRIDHGSKLLLVGDAKQKDLKDDSFERVINKLQGLKNLGIVNLGVEDIQRHPIVGSVIARLNS